VEKLTLKNSTYKSAIAKLEAQLVHKEEMGEVLHMVDFDQLKIENQQYLERIDAKNKELLQLKLSSGRTVQVRPKDVAGVLWRYKMTKPPHNGLLMMTCCYLLANHNAKLTVSDHQSSRNVPASSSV